MSLVLYNILPSHSLVGGRFIIGGHNANPSSAAPRPSLFWTSQCIAASVSPSLLPNSGRCCGVHCTWWEEKGRPRSKHIHTSSTDTHTAALHALLPPPSTT